MAARKTKASNPAPARPKRAPKAAELPVTRAMLGEVRTELFQRIDQSKSELRAEIQEVKAEVHQVKAELHGVQAGLHGVQAGLHAVQAEVARIGFLFEEQNACNKVVLDALTA